MLPPPAPVVTVHEDFGGLIDAFAARVIEYRERGVRVRIEGDCISACTMVTALPRDRICVGEHASLQFHQGFTDPDDPTTRSELGTAIMMRFYPKRVLAWIASMGGLTADLIVLRGAELRRMFRACP